VKGAPDSVAACYLLDTKVRVTIASPTGCEHAKTLPCGLVEGSRWHTNPLSAKDQTASDAIC
jgi:hypothetical protein